MDTNRLQRTNPNRFLVKSSPWQQFQYVLELKSRENRVSLSFSILEPTALWVTLGRKNLFAVALACRCFNSEEFVNIQSNTFLSQLQPWPSFHLLRILIPLLPLLFHLNTYLVYGLYRHPIYNKAILFIVPRALRVPKPAHFCSRVCSWSSSVLLSLSYMAFGGQLALGWHSCKPASGTDLEPAWVLDATSCSLH